MAMMSRREREMLLDQLRGQPQIGGAATPLAATQATPATPPQGQLTGKNLSAINALRRKPTDAMSAAMSATSPTAFTALAKAGLAGFAGHKGRKERGKEADVLKKAMQSEADKAARDEEREIKRQKVTDARLERSLVIQEQNALAKRQGLPMTEYQEKSLQLKRDELEAKGKEIKTYDPTGEERKTYRKAHGLEKQFQNLDGMAAKMTPEQIEGLAKPLADIPLGMAPNSVKRYLEENVVYTDAEQRDYRVAVAKIESDFSRMMSGLAVSGFEMADRKNWSPYAEGISQASRQQRLDNLQMQTRDEIGLYNDMYPQAALPSPWEKAQQEMLDLNAPGSDALYEAQGAQPAGAVDQSIPSNADQQAANLEYLQQQQQPAGGEPKRTGKVATNDAGVTLYEYDDGKWRDG